MIVGLLDTKATLRARYLLSVFQAGVDLHRDVCVRVQNRSQLDRLDQVDVAVQVCLANRHHAGDEQALFRLAAQECLQKRKRRLLVIDSGFVRGQQEYIDAMARDSTLPLFDIDHASSYRRVDTRIYYELGFDGIKGRADHVSEGAPDDRWAKLKQPLQPWRDPAAPGYILVLGQPRYGQSTQELDIYRWYGETLSAIAQLTNREIVIRAHPRLRGSRGAPERALISRMAPAGRVRWSPEHLLAADLAGASVAVVCSSNAAVNAVIAGVPTIATSPACMAYPVAGHSIEEIVAPPTPDRTQWANMLAYSQWNCHEFRDGTAWARLRPHAVRR